MSSLFIWASEIPDYKFDVKEEPRGNCTITLLTFSKKNYQWKPAISYPTRQRAEEELESFKKRLEDQMEAARYSIDHIDDTLEGLERLLDEGPEKIQPHRDVIQKNEKSLKIWETLKVFEIKIS